MKELVLILCLLTIFKYSAFTQTYYPMPEDSATWTVVEYGYPFLGPTEKGTWHYGLSGDTIIQGNLYQKLYVNPGSLGSVNPEICFNRQTAQYKGAIREDSTKKIWFWEENTPAEVLYYDFNLNLGDTFCFPVVQPATGTSCFPVSSIDSILIDGNYRRQIHFNDANGSEAWIEGIGSLTGWFTYWTLIGNIEWELECYSENNNLMYGDSLQCSCLGTGTNIKPINSITSDVNVFPNPATSVINIETPNLSGTKEISIYSVLGHEIKTVTMVGNSLSINIDQIKENIVFLVIKCENGNQWLKKIVKNIR